jgi:YVTN family beta-propeller protein
MSILRLLLGGAIVAILLSMAEPFAERARPFSAGSVFAEGTSKVYIPDPVSDTVAVFNPSTHRVVKTIHLGDKPAGRRDDPRGVALSPDGRYAYLTNHGSDTVTVIDTDQDEAVRRIALPLPEPGNIAMDPKGGVLYIPHYSAKAVTILNVPENTSRVIHLEGFPGDAAVTRDGRAVLITSRDSSALLVLDPVTGHVSSVPVGLNPVGIGVTPDGGEAYVSHDNARIVVVVDLKTMPFRVKGIIDVDMAGGSAVAVAPDGGHVFVAHCCSNSAVSVIQTSTKSVACHLPLAPKGLDPVRIVFSPDGSEVFVINSQSRNVSIIHPPCGKPRTENIFR